MILINLEKPFLEEANWVEFIRLFRLRVSELKKGSAIINACENEIEFLAVLFAGLENGCSVFVCNPQWEKEEWAKVAELGDFNFVFGKSPIVASSIDRRFDQRLMIPTGGTSGGVRFCVHSVDTICSAIESVRLHSGLPELNSVSLLPLCHVSGLMPVLRAWKSGGVVQLEKWDSVKEGKLPVLLFSHVAISLVPTQLAQVLNIDGSADWLGKFETIFIGGAGVNSEFIELVRGLGLAIKFVYGMTETAAMVVSADLSEVDKHDKIWGHTLPGVTLELSANDLIKITAESLFYGYYPEDEKKSYFITSDLGEMDKFGRLLVLGRNDFIINTGGEKVNPQEVEDVIRKHLPRSRIAVCGVPDSKWGERVVALIDVELSVEVISGLKTKLNSILASFKQPKEILSNVNLPYTSLGKLKRGELVNIYKQLKQ